jgi:hypothetical protein
MLRPSLSSLTAISLSLLLLAAPAFAFNSPLSDEAIREAYFLGQRHDESMAIFLAKYKKVFRAPETGPYISSVEFLTPFARQVLLSSQRVNYSAQQAVKEHRSDDELVAVAIEIQLTQSYGAILSAQTSTNSHSPISYTLRPADFWKDFDVQVLSEEKSLEPTLFTGEPNYTCGDYGRCVLIGATIRLELPAKLFASDAATVQVTPPEGSEVSVDFDLTKFR